MRSIKGLQILLAVLFLASCTNNGASSGGALAGLAKLTSDQQFSFATQVSATESYIKFVVFTEGTEPTIEFIDSQKYNLHVDYIKSAKGVKDPVADIYKQARFNEGRRYFFGSFIATDNFSTGSYNSFQITAEDPLSTDDIVKVGRLVKDSMESMEDTQLYYMPSGNQAKFVSEMTEQKKLELAGFPVKQTGAHESKTYFSALVPGRLVKVKAGDISSGAYAIKGDEILLLDHVPDSLPPVRGVITSTPTSPNSHVSLLANMYSIPFVYQQNAFESEDLAALDGKRVLFKAFPVSNNDKLYLAQELDEKTYTDLETSWLTRFPQVPINLNDANLLALNGFPEIGKNDANLNVGTCGAKASNGDLLVKSIGSKNSIEGFCIPFFFFNKFMSSNTVGKQSLRDFILDEIGKIQTSSKLEDVDAILIGIKERINAATIPAEDIASIKKMIVATYGANASVKKIRFRSSSNAEDDERFNGAGLYESDGLKMEHVLKNNDKKIEESLKIVWSSLYGLRAVLARKIFNIDESRVYMGVLINQAFDETANGVSVCQIPSSSSNELNCMIEGYPGGELSVAHPHPGKTTEIISATASENFEFGVLTHVLQYTSELEQFQRLLSSKEEGELFKMQEKVYTHWSTVKKPGFRGVLDFEWKRMEDAATGASYMALKQVREVPQKLMFGLKEPAILLPQNVEFSGSTFNTTASLVPLFTERHLRFEIPSLTRMSDTKTLKTSAKIHADDFSGLNIPLPIKKVEYLEGKWSAESGENQEQRAVTTVFTTTHPKLGDLKIHLIYQQTRQGGATLATDNVVDHNSVSVSTEVIESQITGNKKDKNVVESSFEFGEPVTITEPKTTNYCIKNEAVATVVQTKFSPGIYLDGVSHMDEVKFTKKAFKALTSGITVTAKNALISFDDSHAFEAGQYVSIQSVYIDPKTAKSVGLKEEDHFVVIASGTNFDAEEPLQDKMILYNGKRKILETRELSACPGDELEE